MLGLFENGEDSLDAFYTLIEFAQIEGYPKEFYVNKSDEATIRLIDELKKIDYREDDECAHRFFHTICKPIIDKDDIIFNYAFYIPDSVEMSNDISTATMSMHWGRPNLKRQGLYKVMLLFYFSKMIKTYKE